ncbi:MAG: CRISPR-associated endonuclease Cas2 [Ignavibacteria bacterium]|jgi:CRISPR-associated protein Cas2|nr:CRISPR-associated endonuclease Cas2 [Ignavibacteria bacterium]MDH7528590.1 CRISPR-associated endonuclease Cas2 [Ignavibacteria bacterium]NPV11342.1 CRISPR-associated endonuclease Cas2 [Ignavibacteria bacterium]
MYVILVYDAAPKRGQKVLKFLRKKLNWVQNSVFEGDITEASFMELKKEIEQLIDKKYDSIIYYVFDSKNYFERGIIGLEKSNLDTII